ncbi:MAG: hypothetical protein KIS73_21865 [Enhydrobacter sp.]|nr:hypothetical protein [Enhydrobacter sp.]
MESDRKTGIHSIKLPRNFTQALLIVFAAAVVAAVVGFGANYLLSPSAAEIQRGVDAAKEMPLVGLVIEENPPLEEKLRMVIAEELNNPGQVPSPGSRFGVEVRQQYIVPTLLAADDASALSAAAGMEKLARYLQMRDPALCRELGLAGLQNANKLDADGKTLLNEALALQEQAYRNGKGGSPKTALKADEVRPVLEEAGYTEKDLEQLSSFATLSTADGCAATVKLYGAPRALPTAGGGTLARWLLTVAP